MLNYIIILKKIPIVIFTTSFYLFFFIKSKLKNMCSSLNLYSIFFFFRRYFLYNGKIFRLKLFKQKIKFIINRSHRVYLYFKSKIRLKKISKKKYKIYFFYLYDMYILKNFFNIIRGLNVYT